MYKLERIQRRAIRVLYKLNFASIVSISDLMRSLSWLKFIYICIHYLVTLPWSLSLLSRGGVSR